MYIYWVSYAFIEKIILSKTISNEKSINDLMLTLKRYYTLESELLKVYTSI